MRSTLELQPNDLLGLYRYMLLSRHFDERVNEIYRTTKDKVHELPHSHIGQEAIGVGSCYGLRNDDYILPSLRTRPAIITRGVPVKLMIAGIFGRRTGPAEGRVTTHHLGDHDFGIIGTTGVVGGHIAPASGVALACKVLKKESVVLCFFGDGATNQGDFHEASNFAALQRLPLILIVENNQIAAMTMCSNSIATGDIARRAEAYGFPGIKIDGNDVIEVYNRVQEAVTRAREGQGPTLIECVTYRVRGHAEGVPDNRAAEEIENWKKKDPLIRFNKVLVEKGILTKEKRSEIEKEVETEIEDAIRFAEESPPPDPKDMTKHVYGPPVTIDEQIPSKRSETTVGKALNQAIREEMERDDRVILMGEDIGKDAKGLPGGVWPSTRNLCLEFPDRVIGTPISESEIVGAAAGAALAGLRPIAEIMFADFMTLAMDHIINYIAKMRYNYGGKSSVPLVIRAPFGVGGSMGLHHSQSPEAWLMNIPGLKIVMPSMPVDAKGLMKASIRDDDPVIFFEHKRVYGIPGDVPDDDYVIPFGKADVKRRGEHATIVATALMVHRALSAAARLEKEGIEVEVIDPRTILPLDRNTIIASVKKTSRLVIVHEAPKTGGIGGEIASTVAEEAIEYLDAPIQRIGAPFAPVPFTRHLEEAYAPSEEQIIATVRAILKQQ